MDKEILLANIDKVHTTEMGFVRIKKKLLTHIVIQSLQHIILKMKK